MPDWNWFFAAYAQSLAAIIAIIGAFTVSKLISEEDRGNELRYRLERLENRLLELEERAKARFPEWLIDRDRKRAEGHVKDYFKEQIQEDRDVELDEAFYQTHPHFSEYTHPDLIEQTLEEARAEAKREIKDERRERTQSRSPFQPNIDLSHIQPPNLPNIDITTRVEEEQDKLNEVYADCLRGLADREDLLAEVHRFNAAKGGLIRVLAFLVILFEIGVIVPLSFLPLDKRPPLATLTTVGRVISPKGLLLVFAAIGIAGFFGYFMWRAHQSVIEDSSIPTRIHEMDEPGDFLDAFRWRKELEEHIDDLKDRNPDD